jgi:CubicO group peptidase (beta-lactamase class C family)
MKYFALLLFIIIATIKPVHAQDEPPEFVLLAEDAVIEFFSGTDDADADRFMDQAMVISDSSKRDSIRQSLLSLRLKFRPAINELGIMGSPEGLEFVFSNDGIEKRLWVKLNENGITHLEEMKAEKKLKITAETLSSLVDSLENEGLAGLLYIEKEGKRLISRPFGYANEALNIRNSNEIIFGTGSRPIDYTIASILLLDQRGALSLDDPITTFYDNVPADKQSMTIRHLMNGQSGLPDFFETKDDWDTDLAWIDRETAEKRLLNIKLLFSPGTDQRHSHAAFGLLAAIIERVSGLEYYTFIRTNFLDPAGMDRTGEYGERRGLNVEDFAVGNGTSQVGLPNIPPNWGPTSWLIKGSGGMYSTLGDLQKFYSYVRSGEVLDEDHQRIFMSESVQLDGSVRGFELFSIAAPQKNTSLYFFLNDTGDIGELRKVFRALERFTLSN